MSKTLIKQISHYLLIKDFLDNEFLINHAETVITDLVELENSYTSDDEYLESKISISEYHQLLKCAEKVVDDLHRLPNRNIEHNHYDNIELQVPLNHLFDRTETIIREINDINNDSDYDIKYKSKLYDKAHDIISELDLVKSPYYRRKAHETAQDFLNELRSLTGSNSNKQQDNDIHGDRDKRLSYFARRQISDLVDNSSKHNVGDLDYDVEGDGKEIVNRDRITYERVPSVVFGNDMDIVESFDKYDIRLSDLLISSLVITEKMIIPLLKWIQDAMDGHFVRCHLLYRVSRDGGSCIDFHKHCDGKKNTLTIVTDSHGHIFGGFTDIPWDSPEKVEWNYSHTMKSFLFQLYPEVIKFAQFRHPDRTTCSYNLFGPTFGDGHDLHISCATSLHNVSSYSCMGVSYSSRAPEESLGKSKKFFVEDFEVYEVVYEKGHSSAY